MEARISGREQDKVIAIPRGALRPQDKLWLLDADDRLQVKDVVVLQADDEEMLVQGDFDGPLRVVVSPLTMALPGMPLNPVPAPTQSGE